MVNANAKAPAYDFLDPEGHLLDYPSLPTDADLEGRVVVIVDNSDLDRIGELKKFVAPDRSNLIVIDHHDHLECDSQTYFLDANASSTAEMIFNLLEFAQIEPSLEVGRAIYTGIIADTGHFRYKKTTQRTHEIAGALLQLGVRSEQVAELLYEQFNVERLFIRKKMYGGVELNPEKTMAWFQVRMADLQQSGATTDDMEGIINELLEPESIKVAILFREKEEQITKVSVRSKGNIDMIPAVDRFGGGGHKNACGATIPLDLTTAIKEFIPAASKCMEVSLSA